MTTPFHRPFATALESLTHRHQQLLTLHEINHQSTEHIGQLLGMTPGQVRIELLHARLAMRQHLSTSTRNAA
jgi:DNA-directed RNA polymerase specialized sigma24 family protein